MSSAMIAMTTSNSISVNPLRVIRSMPTAYAIVVRAHCRFAPRRPTCYVASALWKCDSWIGTTSSSTCCSTAPGEPIASTSWMMSAG